MPVPSPLPRLSPSSQTIPRWREKGEENRCLAVLEFGRRLRQLLAAKTQGRWCPACMPCLHVCLHALRELKRAESGMIAGLAGLCSAVCSMARNMVLMHPSSRDIPQYSKQQISFNDISVMNNNMLS